MKKTISILLAVLMACTLFACAAKEDDTPPDSAAVSSTPPSGSAPDSSASGTAEGEAADITKNADELGFFYDGVDPQSRDTYEIVFAYPWTSLLNQSLADCMRHFGKKLNLNVTQSTSENDMDQFVLNLETYIGQGNTDGFVAVIDYAALDRINEVLAESGIPYIGLFNSVKDESGSELIPCVGLDDIAAGATTLQWLYDNYKTYWGDVDESKIGLLNITTTVNIDLDERAIGAEEKIQGASARQRG